MSAPFPHGCEPCGSLSPLVQRHVTPAITYIPTNTHAHTQAHGKPGAEVQIRHACAYGGAALVLLTTTGSSVNHLSVLDILLLLLQTAAAAAPAVSLCVPAALVQRSSRPRVRLI